MILALITSVVFLLTQLLDGRTHAPALLRDAALIWVANVLTFALWYWEIDGGGPAKRHRDGYASRDFVFPQVAIGLATDAMVSQFRRLPVSGVQHKHRVQPHGYRSALSTSKDSDDASGHALPTGVGGAGRPRDQHALTRAPFARPRLRMGWPAPRHLASQQTRRLTDLAALVML